MHNIIEIPAWERLFKKIVWKQIGNLEGKKILDFGSGEGITANHFAKKNDVTAIEPSEEMLSNAWKDYEYTQIVGDVNALSDFGEEYENSGNAGTDDLILALKWVKKNIAQFGGDPDNVEGRAAAYYWKNIFPGIPYFVRGQDGISPNSLLNYGYAIVRAIIARSLVSSGLLPTLGIHHHNRYNAYCLADDIMEPYRPYVDKLVVDIVNSGDKSPVLTKDIKKVLLSIPTIDVKIDGHRSPLMVAATTTTASLCKCFNGELRRVIYPEM